MICALNGSGHVHVIVGIVRLWLHDVKVGLGIGVGRLFVASPLDFLADHAHGESRTSSQKEFVVVGSCICPLGEAAKAV
jgi:hypothetical protein